MRVIGIERCSSGFGEWQIAMGAEAFRAPLKGAKREEDIEGLVHHGGPGGASIHGRVYDLPGHPGYVVRLS